MIIGVEVISINPFCYSKNRDAGGQIVTIRNETWQSLSLRNQTGSQRSHCWRLRTRRWRCDSLEP
ncbi:MAG: hypothetical protein P4L90_19480 [Rhodopila sp.]|nr:hypothetical protein [Rhodopila sp.]